MVERAVLHHHHDDVFNTGRRRCRQRPDNRCVRGRPAVTQTPFGGKPGRAQDTGSLQQRSSRSVHSNSQRSTGPEQQRRQRHFTNCSRTRCNGSPAPFFSVTDPVCPPGRYEPVPPRLDPGDAQLDRAVPKKLVGGRFLGRRRSRSPYRSLILRQVREPVMVFEYGTQGRVQHLRHQVRFVLFTSAPTAVSRSSQVLKIRACAQ